MPSQLDRAAERLARACLEFARCVQLEQEKVRCRLARDIPLVVEGYLAQRRRRMSAAQVAKHFKISRNEVYRAVQTGDLPAVRGGTPSRVRWLVEEHDAEVWYAQIKKGNTQ